MNFLTEKIQKYHKKKLNDALQELQFHQEIKKRLETNLKTTDDESKRNIEEKIGKENENEIDILKKQFDELKHNLSNK